MLKHQFIERATEVTWMLLLISFWLFVDLWLRLVNHISILDISNAWLKTSFDVSDGIGIIVTYSFIMAGLIPGLRFALPLFLSLIYAQLCIWFNWKIKHDNDRYLKDYCIEEEKVKYQAIAENNSILWNAYAEHTQVKISIIKQQTVCQSILFFIAAGSILPETTTYLIQAILEFLDQQVWWVDYPLCLIFFGFFLFLFGIGFSNLKHTGYMPIKVSQVAEKRNKKD